ncbi:hypothetical protein CF15_02425 [Pyrodictium occultum]|uniref:Uncharacterized protein n=1 Tax=Pyrodictium occultum TaxID=2309 RepID=A0A0V8RUL4_PYROC|nr:hypothetical protein [Pyrodictium occultum]KSW11693.1 hypothetical protein CF15_02425 [Pyrodictium occultum]
MFALLFAIGLVGIKSSDYRDVSSLKNLEYKAYVTVKGRPVSLSGTYLLRVGDTLFLVKGYGSYAVASRVSGPRFGSDDSYAVFILEGQDGHTKILALYSATTFKTLYGGSPAVSSRIVVEGTYDPALEAVLLDPSTGSRVAGPYSVLLVSKIFEGCHESYKAPAGRVEG